MNQYLGGYYYLQHISVLADPADPCWKLTVSWGATGGNRPSLPCVAVTGLHGVPRESPEEGGPQSRWEGKVGTGTLRRLPGGSGTYG